MNISRSLISIQLFILNMKIILFRRSLEQRHFPDKNDINCICIIRLLNKAFTKKTESVSHTTEVYNDAVTTCYHRNFSHMRLLSQPEVSRGMLENM